MLSDAKPSQRLITLTNPNSFVAEQYRNLRTKLFQRIETNTKQAILVTSALPKEGKTITSVNLAISIAQSFREKVLLVDADLRQPSIHPLFGVKPVKGLSDYLKEDIDLEALLLPTPLENLAFLPAGTPIANPTELLESAKMGALVKEIKSRYIDRFVIFDSPPIIHISDPLILAKHVDLTILVVLAGKTSQETISKALGFYGIKNIMGVVLNKLEALPVEYSYTGKYGKYYSNQQTKKKTKSASEQSDK